MKMHGPLFARGASATTPRETILQPHAVSASRLRVGIGARIAGRMAHYPRDHKSQTVEC